METRCDFAGKKDFNEFADLIPVMPNENRSLQTEKTKIKCQLTYLVRFLFSMLHPDSTPRRYPQRLSPQT